MNAKYAGDPHKFMAIYSKTYGRCWYCGFDSGKKMTIDHINPQIFGGSDEVKNLVPCCSQCNSGKREKTVEEFRTALRLKLFQNEEGAPFFSWKQINWLRDQGFDLIDFCGDVVFFFEEQCDDYFPFVGSLGSYLARVVLAGAAGQIHLHGEVATETPLGSVPARSPIQSKAAEGREICPSK